MKALVTTSFVVLGLLSGAAHAAQKNVFTQINESAPHSGGVFEDLNKSAPKADDHATPRGDTFSDLNRTAPRSDGVFGDLEKSAP